MATFTVTSLADEGRAGTLRAVLAQANATAAADTIVFAPGLDGGTLTLTGGQLNLTSDVTIDGDRNNDGREVQVSGGDVSRVLNIGGSGTDARLVDLTVANGSTYADPFDQQAGGGIRIGAGQALSLSGVTVTDNAAAIYRPGGGIFAGQDARLTITGSTISGNGADGGGGIFLSQGASARIDTSQITGNSSSDGSPSSDHLGGGIQLVDASLVLTRSTVDNNTATDGAGILASNSQLTINNSTIAENSTLSALFGGAGGGLNLYGGYAFIANSTIVRNAIGRYDASDADTSGGIDLNANARLSLANTIVAANYQSGDLTTRTAAEVDGTIAFSNGHNVFGSDVAGSAPGDVEGAGPGFFGGLRDNGGPTPTIRVFGYAGSGAEPVASSSIDQRGFTRPIPDGTNSDIGAFEVADGFVSRTPSTFNDVLTGTGGANTIAALAGNDLALGQGGNDRLFGGSGGDTLVGGLGADVLDGDSGLDTASYRDGSGSVTVSLAGGTASGAAGADRLFELENLEGGRFADSLTGNAGRNWLGGLDGDDRLFALAGDDVLRGNAGADRLTGGPGRDRLEGGTGNEVFDFNSVADSPASAGRTTGDTITDFARGGDDIDLATIDARAGAAGNQAFVFLAREGATFTGAGQVRWFQDDGSTFVEASTDTDATAELQVRLAGLTILSTGDFVL